MFQLDSAQETQVLFSDSLTQSTSKPFRFHDIESRDSSEDSVIVPQRLELFTSHLLKPHSVNAESYNTFTLDWFTIVLLGMLGLLTWFKVFYFKIFSQLWNAFFSLTTT